MIMSTTTHYGDAVELYFRCAAHAGGLEDCLPAFGLCGWPSARDSPLPRRYHELTSRGMPHEQAASKVFFEHFDSR